MLNTVTASQAENVVSTSPEETGTIETFEDFETSSTNATDMDMNDWSKPEVKKEGSKETRTSEQKKILNDSDESSAKDGKKEDKKEEKKEDKKEEEDKKELEKSPEENKVEDKKEDKSKKVRLKIGEETFGIEPDAKVKVKVDGNNEEVSIQDLINNYSGKVAYDKKFSEVGNQKKEVESLKSEVIKYQTELKSTVEEITSILSDKSKNPWDAMIKLVEKAGKDPYAIYERAFETQLNEFLDLYEMSEVERENYLLKKKDEFRSRSEENRKTAIETELNSKQVIQKVDALRQAHGVSEDEFLGALDELEGLWKSRGLNPLEVTEEQAVDWASLKPRVREVQELMEPFSDKIDDSKYEGLVKELAVTMRDSGVTSQQVQKWLEENFGVEEELKELNSLIQKPGPKSKALATPSDKIETFDDLF